MPHWTDGEAQENRLKGERTAFLFIFHFLFLFLQRPSIDCVCALLIPSHPIPASNPIPSIFILKIIPPYVLYFHSYFYSAFDFVLSFSFIRLFAFLSCHYSISSCILWLTYYVKSARPPHSFLPSFLPPSLPVLFSTLRFMLTSLSSIPYWWHVTENSVLPYFTLTLIICVWAKEVNARYYPPPVRLWAPVSLLLVTDRQVEDAVAARTVEGTGNCFLSCCCCSCSSSTCCWLSCSEMERKE